MRRRDWRPNTHRFRLKVLAIDQIKNSQPFFYEGGNVMIKVPFPHMVLNAHSAPGEEYQMWNTWKVAQSTSVDQMVGWIATVAKSAPEGKLETLIFNGHGAPGKIKIGQHITRQDVEKFRVLKDNNLVKRIWIVACKVARIGEAGGITDGNYFCYRLAQESGAYVRASSARQYAYPDILVANFIPWGHIDEWEGDVFTWNPKGDLC
jgi:hypothetical protein